jgi:ATP synthase protein I
MTLPEGEQPPASFEERLDAARLRQGMDARPDAAAPAKGFADPLSPMGIGMRVGIELVCALMVGVGIGWLLDRWLHTTPVFIAVFVLLGGAAGVLNVWRMMGPKAHRPH